MKMNIKPATVARIAALIVALINQCLVMFNHNSLPFTEDLIYQVVSFAAVVVISAINAWYNNDISKVALLCGGVYDALSDGKVTEREIEKLLTDVEDTEKIKEVAKDNFFVKFINGIVKSLKSKIGKE